MNLLFSAYSSSLAQARKRLPVPGPASVAGGFAHGNAGLASLPRRRLLKGTVSVLALGGASPLLSACGGEYTGEGGVQDAPTPVMHSVANFRDIGGAAPGYSTSDGGHVKRAQIYRSDTLTPNADDATTLEHMALTYIYDLRTPGEAGNTPLGAPGTANSLALNVLGTLAPPSFANMQAGELDAAMQWQWRNFVTGRAQCNAYGALLEHIAEAPGPRLICGGTGVDVVGWASALLLLIANVPLEIVVADFLLTNAWRSTSADTLNVAPPVQASYLQTAFDALQTNFGDLNRYLSAGLGLSSTTVNALRAQLLA
ncbi:tyrosine-protein phosphatase [Paraburkholderia acidisoli]|uniref:Protein-tyrosine-phosphatase n=1 Tax=Paraburkholderia acidisoli TaxID=2571748 RepID=A0A7Z2JI87_9BURK|nr:tyrosine-protein phosphatase [Paraburkholderia acidisoli]QGZ65451.1 protein-tyrosine-phosphatase [Paraburkholderia acidisoli]